MQKRTFVMSSAIIVVAIILTVTLSFSFETLAVLSSINPVGILAAMFAAIIGFIWLLKKR